MRLKFFCDHEYRPIGTARGENMLGSVVYAVVFECSRCLKIKRKADYGSQVSAEKDLKRYVEAQND